LPAESLGPPVPGHTYSEGVVQLFWQMVMDAACSFRAASAVLRLLEKAWPALRRAPVANTGQNWLLRMGLHELTRPKEAAEDWVWIVDHTIQIGKTKCLLIVGCRLSTWQGLGRPLELRDLQMFALEPVKKSDGVIVAGQLQETCRKTGIVPRAIVSDEGTDLLSGYRLFCAAHPQVAICSDIAHQAAKWLARELENDDRWKAFLRQSGGVKQRLAQTPWAYLLPPTPRSKARYMNLGELVAWGENTLRHLDHPRPIDGQPVDVATLRTKLGWLEDYRTALVEWGQWMAIVALARQHVREKGYHRASAEALRQLLTPHATTTGSTRLADRLIEFVASQSSAAKEGERLMGSSECLESLIGKGKRLEGQQSRSGFTKTILGMAAAVVQPTRENVVQSLEAVKTHDLLAWCREKLGISVQSQRRQALAVTGTKMG
jgi:hypothetical protein